MITASVMKELNKKIIHFPEESIRWQKGIAVVVKTKAKVQFDINLNHLAFKFCNLIP